MAVRCQLWRTADWLSEEVRKGRWGAWGDGGEASIEVGGASSEVGGEVIDEGKYVRFTANFVAFLLLFYLTFALSCAHLLSVSPRNLGGVPPGFHHASVVLGVDC
jgi:hypothetical protein